MIFFEIWLQIFLDYLFLLVDEEEKQTHQDAKDGKINEETDDYSDSEDQYDTEMDNDLSSLNNIDGMEKLGKFF